MKKVLISICTAFCLMVMPLSAFEWGGLFSNNVGVTTPETTVKLADSISLWFNSPLGQDSGFAISGETIYKFNLAIPVGGETEVSHIFDLPLLKVSGSIDAGAGLFTINAGRFYYVDPTGAVISQTIDGVSAGYSVSGMNVGLFAGYTGLLNSLNVPMAVASTKTNNVYRMAYPYLPLGLTFEVPFAANQSVELGAYYLVDCGSNKNNLCYADLVLSGPITNFMYYNVATSFGFVNNFKDIVNYSALNLMLFPTQEISVNAGVSYGSAEQGPFKSYTSLASVALTAANAITPKAGFTFTTGNMCIDFNGDYVLAYNEGKYKGANTNLSASFIYNIFSDLQIGLTGNASIDVSGAKANTYGGNLNIALAF